MTAGFIAKRWRRWLTYFLSLVPIIAVMLVWFFNLDRVPTIKNYANILSLKN